jgi:hypothetical protein
VTFLLISVVSETDEIVFVRESDDSAGIGLSHGEEMLESCLHPEAELSCEIIEDEVRIDLRHGLQLLIHVVSQHHILHSEVESGTDWQVANNETIGLSSMFMQQHQIS